MSPEEYRLLHLPDLMLALLKAASGGAAEIGDALDLLARGRKAAGEPPVVPIAQVRARLERALAHLDAAGLVGRGGPGYFITPRGRSVLHEHPQGIDPSILVAFPEYRRWIAVRSAHPCPEDAKRPDFIEGWSAFLEGCGLTANPFQPDTAQHAAWEDGWLEASRQRGDDGTLGGL